MKACHIQTNPTLSNSPIFYASVTSESMAGAIGIIFDTADVSIMFHFNTHILADMAFTLNHADGIYVFS